MAELQRRVDLARALADRLEAATLPQVLTDREAMVFATAVKWANAERALAAVETVGPLNPHYVYTAEWHQESAARRELEQAARAMRAAMTGGGR